MKHSIACKIAVSLLMVILGLQVFTACEDDPKPGPGVPSPRLTDFPSLVQIYTKMKDLPTSQNVLDYRVIRIADYWEGEELNILPEIPFYAYSDSISHKELFNYLTTVNNDTCFHEGVEYYEVGNVLFHNMLLQISYIEDITDLQITAVTDFDAEHPAGSNLEDICYISYGSVDKYVHSGYSFDQAMANGLYPLYHEYAQENLKDFRAAVYLEEAEKHCWKMGMKEIMYHELASEVNPEHPLKMLAGFPPTLSFTHKPNQKCQIEVTRTAQIPGGKFPARVSKRVYTIQ